MLVGVDVLVGVIVFVGVLVGVWVFVGVIVGVLVGVEVTVGIDGSHPDDCATPNTKLLIEYGEGVNTNVPNEFVIANKLVDGSIPYNWPPITQVPHTVTPDALTPYTVPLS